MEVLAEVPETGTKLRFESDREFDGGPQDATLRIRGSKDDGSPTHDGIYVEVTPEEAGLVAWFTRAIRQPTPELRDRITQEIQAAYGSCLTGKEAQQVADLAWGGIMDTARSRLNVHGRSAAEHTIERLAERFDRASTRAQAATPTAGSMGRSRH